MQDRYGANGTNRSIFTPYLAAWILMAIVASSYIAVAAVRPDLLTTSLAPAPAIAPAESNEGQRATTAAAGEHDPLQMQREMLALKQRLAQAEAEARIRKIEEQKARERLAALEQTGSADATDATTRAETATEPAGENKAEAAGASSSANSEPGIQTATVLNAPSPQSATAKETNPAKAGTDTGAAEKAAKDIAKVKTAEDGSATKQKAANTTTLAKNSLSEIEDEPAKPKPSTVPVPAKRPKLETASVERKPAPAIDFGPAVVTSAARPIGVRIATGPSVDSLRLSWSALSDRHGSSLRSLKPRYMTGIGATGLTYDLVAGPLATEQEANLLCQRLAASGVRCTIGEYTGNAL